MAEKPRSAQEIMKAADKDEDGRYALSEADIAEMIAGVVMRLRKPEADETDEAESADEPRSGSMAQDRAAFDDRFPNARRLVGLYGMVREQPATKATVAARDERFPNANRLCR